MRRHQTIRSAGARLIAAALGAVLCSQCTEPTRAPGPEGHWIMIAVNGSPLPAVISADATMIFGDLDLNSDGTFLKHTTAAIAGAEFHASSAGHWSVDGTQIEFRPSTGPAQIGAWRDGAIEIQDVRTVRYVPASAALPSPRTTTPPASPGGSAPGKRPPRFSVSSSPARSARP